MSLSRRRFVAAGTAASGLLVAAALGVPIVGFILSPLYRRQKPSVERAVGDISSVQDGSPKRFLVKFPENEWDAGVEQPQTIYVVRTEGRLLVFANVCTHMQCPVHWDPQVNLFLCPCHGGLYSIDGTNVGGPPPKPLPQLAHRLEGSVLYVRNQLEEQI
jgi:quinol---cytochrome c reductase iron-sulfur subunit, bacillus type